MISPAPSLSRDELQRYHRHLILPEVGLDGQRALASARVVLVGAGGLGSPAALYLAAAGVGQLGIVDDDAVDVSNLQRQIIHGTSDVGRLKVASARARLADVNPHVRVVTHAERLTSENAMALLADYDVVIDGSDNFATRYLVNDACVLLGKPYVYGSILRFEGQASVFATAEGPCYRCLFREPPPPGLVPGCAEAGVFGVLPGLVGVVQATEAIKLILGVGDSLAGRLLLVDALRMRFRAIAVRRDPECPACGTRTITRLIDYEEFCAGVGANGDVSGGGDAHTEIAPTLLSQRLGRGDAIQLVDVREPHEWEIARLPGARLIPLSSLPAGAEALDAARETVVYCHHGIRSERAAELLRGAGFGRVLNLAGGIDRWSLDVDPAVRRY